MNETSNRRPVMVGLFIILGIAFLVGGVLMVGNLRETFKRKMGIVSFFDDVNGLQKGNNIWFSGVKIGTVSSLRFYGKSQVAVSLNIETKVQQYIRKDAKVKISTDGLIGNKILVIFGGTERFNQVEEGDTLMVEKTITSEEMLDTLQQNNRNILAITSGFKDITTDFKVVSTDMKAVSKKLTSRDGTLGKLLNDNTLYNNINTASATLKNASAKAQELTNSLNDFSANLNKKGTLANELTTDTVVFNSIKNSILQLQNIADSAALLVTNIKETANNPNSPVGVLLHDEEAGDYLKGTMQSLESGSKKLDENLEALKHNFLFRRYFKKKAKEEAKKKEEALKQ